MGGSDVQKAEFIRCLLVINLGDLNRVPGLSKIDKAHPLDHQAILHIQAGYNTLGQH
jgi:hypothetical protein